MASHVLCSLRDLCDCFDQSLKWKQLLTPHQRNLTCLYWNSHSRNLATYCAVMELKTAGSYADRSKDLLCSAPAGLPAGGHTGAPSWKAGFLSPGELSENTVNPSCSPCPNCRPIVNRKGLLIFTNSVFRWCFITTKFFLSFTIT